MSNDSKGSGAAQSLDLFGVVPCAIVMIVISARGSTAVPRRLASLTSLPWAVLVVGWLAFALAVAAISRWVVRRLVPSEERDHVQGIAAPLIPALGAAFAILMALTLSERGRLPAGRPDLVSDRPAGASLSGLGRHRPRHRPRLQSRPHCSTTSS